MTIFFVILGWFWGGLSQNMSYAVSIALTFSLTLASPFPMTSPSLGSWALQQSPRARRLAMRYPYHVLLLVRTHARMSGMGGLFAGSIGLSRAHREDQVGLRAATHALERSLDKMTLVEKRTTEMCVAALSHEPGTSLKHLWSSTYLVG